MKVLVSFEISYDEYILVGIIVKNPDDISKGFDKFISTFREHLVKDVAQAATLFVKQSRTAWICSNKTKVHQFEQYYYFTFDEEDKMWRYGTK